MNVFQINKIRELPLREDSFYIGCRPEHMVITKHGEGNLDALVKNREQLGGENLLYLTTEDGPTLVARVDGDNQTSIGDKVGLEIPKARLHQFDRDGRALR